MRRRTWLTSCAGLVACPLTDEAPLDFAHLPKSAQAMATELGLGADQWTTYREQQRRSLALRIDEGSAEHITYYVLQSRRFTRQPPIDPVLLAANKPTNMPEGVRKRFADFAAATVALDERHRLIAELFHALPEHWTAEACFRHTMAFLENSAASGQAARDALYQRRGLSSDSSPRQTLVVDRALALLGEQAKGLTLLAGPGLDLTRREGFRDDMPLRSHQWERLRSTGRPVDCVDVRPEVLAYLKTHSACASAMDLSTTAASATGRYRLAMATNVLLYLDDRALFAAMAGFAQSLGPDGHLLHNDTRFATKAFGEVLGLRVIHFEPVSLGRRQGVEQMDRMVLHQKRPL